MGQLTASQIRQVLALYLILVILIGSLASWIWIIRRWFRDEPVLPDRPLVERKKTPWGGGTILLVLLAYFGVTYGVLIGYTVATRGHLPRRGAQTPAGIDAKEGDKAVPVRKAEPEPAVASSRGPHEPTETPWGLGLPEVMFAQAAINGLLIVLLPLVLRATSGARLRDLGLSLAAWRRQVAVGVVALLLLLPIVYTVQALCLRFLDVPDPRERAHPVQTMLQEDPTGSVAYLAIITAVILAPLLEELLFRGIIQSWLIRAFNELDLRLGRWRARRQPLTPQLAEPTANGFWEVDPGPELEPHQPHSPTHANIGLEGSPKANDFPYRPHSAIMTGAAIAITSILFALLHAPQWPAPIPLFVLAIGLGVVHARTGSLLAPIILHGVFNGLSTIMMFLALEAQPGKGPEKPIEPPVERVAPVEKVPLNLPDVDRVRQGGKR